VSAGQIRDGLDRRHNIMTKILIVLLIAFAFEAFGVITLKQGINVIGAAYTRANRKASRPGKTS